ncbi:hypothetical protein BRD02_04470 [Halobacteriales archaeon QS_8_69_73]|nr:MAG: hypothetical protein BRD02_04470 [Halobacteriales archaeon QS_8_69_73]
MAGLVRGWLSDHDDHLTGAALFGAAFAAGAGLPGRLEVPYVEWFAAAVVLGVPAGWWAVVFWIPDALWVAPTVLAVWCAVVTIESARDPSWRVAVVTMHAVAIGLTTGVLQVLLGLPVIAASVPAAVLSGLLSAPLGIGAFLLGRRWHRSDARPSGRAF